MSQVVLRAIASQLVLTSLLSGRHQRGSWVCRMNLRLVLFSTSWQTLFSAQNALRELAPEFRWAGLGNLLGDYGEFVAIKHYGLVKAPAGANGYDATTPDGITAQIKANHAASTIGFRGEADLLLVIKVEPDGQWVERYYGPFAAVKAIARYSARDNKHMVHIRQLQALLVTE